MKVLYLVAVLFAILYSVQEWKLKMKENAVVLMSN